MASRVSRAEGHAVRRGRAPTAAALRVLAAAYDGWGDERLLEWKADYPRGTRDLFVEDETAPLGEAEITAFARLYRRGLVADGDAFDVVIRGNAAVAPAHQGEGRYAAIHRATEAYCAEHAVEGLCTYNRTDNRSFRTSLKADWTARQLPLYLSILSPAAVLRAYGSEVDVPGVDHPVIARLADRVGVAVDGETVPLSSIVSDAETAVSDAETATKPRVAVSLSDRALDALVERASNDGSAAELARTAASLLVRGDLSLTRPGRRSDADRAPEETISNESSRLNRVDDADSGRVDGKWASNAGAESTVHAAGGRAIASRDPETLSEDDRDRLVDLYRTVHAEYDLHFERSRADVDHLLAHPTCSTVYWAERDGDLAGFAALATTAPEGAVEGRLLDLVGTDERTRRALREAVEADARRAGVDVLALLSASPPGDGWIRIRRHVLAWDRARTRPIAALRTGRWRLGFYDVV